MARKLVTDQASLGSSLTTPQTASLRLGLAPLLPDGGAWIRPAIDNTTQEVGWHYLVANEIPSEYTRRDSSAETIGGSWIWSNPTGAITFAAGSLAPPAPTSRSLGTRLVLEPVAGSTEYALGRETAGAWASVPSGKDHRFYIGNVSRLRISADGGVYVEGGVGIVYVANNSDGSGGVSASRGLNLWANADGAITLYSGTAGASGLIQPGTQYRENLGSPPRKFLSLHAAELWVETLVAQDTLATIGGRVLVGPTTILTRDVLASDTTIYVKHNAFRLHVGGVEYGSKLVLQVAGKLEVLAVTNTSAPAATAQGDYPYTVIRAFGGTAHAWFAGDAVFDTGKYASPSGAFIDLYSVNGLYPGSSAGPTIVGNVRYDGNPFNWQERWAIGNLRGIYNNGAADVFGAAFGSPAGMHLQIDATDGIRMMGSGNTFTYGHWRMNGDLVLGYTTSSALSFVAAEGSLNLQVNGSYKMRLLNDGQMYLSTGLVVGSAAGSAVVRSTLATNWNAGSGFYFWANAAGTSVQALIGNSAGRRIQWDGGSLKVVSDGLTIDEAGISLLAGGPSDVAKQVRFAATGVGGTSGGYLYDSGGSAGSFTVERQNGSIVINSVQTTSVVHLQSGGGSVDRVYVQLQSVFGGPSNVILGGTAGGGQYPRIIPGTNAVSDLGGGSNRWRYAWALNLLLGSTSPATPVYELQLMNDSAVKPTSSTWGIVCDPRAKETIAAVDRADALARVRAVDVIRFTYNGAVETPAGAEAIGVDASAVGSVLPLSVTPGRDGLLVFNAHELFMLNVAAVQALAARVEALERKGTA